MRHFAIAVGLLAASMCSHLNAQTADMTARIPFNFQVGATSMPAGNYAIHQSGGLLTLSQIGVRTIVERTFPASRPSASSTGMLEFHKYGDAYFLSSVWTPLYAQGRALKMGSKEKELARRISSGLVQTAVLKTK